MRNLALTGCVTHTLGAGVHAPDPSSTPHVLAFGGNNQAGPIDVATARNACSSSSSSGRLDFESETFVVQSVSLRGRDGGGTAELGDEVANCLRASGGGGDKPHVLYPIAFDSRQDCVSSPHVFGALGTSSPQAQAVCVTGEITHTLKAEGFDASEDGTGRGQPITAEWEVVDGWAVRRLMPVECERLQAFPDNYTLIPVKKAKKCSKMYDYAEIDGELWQLSADGPRYKALGNSMCVYNMRWIGARIHQHLANPFGDLL